MPSVNNQIAGPKSNIQTKFNLKLGEMNLKNEVSPGNSIDTSQSMLVSDRPIKA